MTIKQAVINVCERMEPGEEILGYQFYNRVLRELAFSGSKKQPLSGTVLRRFREVRELCVGKLKSVSVIERRRSVEAGFVEVLRLWRSLLARLFGGYSTSGSGTRRTKKR